MLPNPTNEQRRAVVVARWRLRRALLATIGEIRINAYGCDCDSCIRSDIDNGNDALKAKVEANPDDFQARLDLAVLLNGANEREAATDQLLYVIKKMRAWNDAAARKQLVKFFEAWGPKDESTLAGRRKLSSVLFS